MATCLWSILGGEHNADIDVIKENVPNCLSSAWLWGIFFKGPPRKTGRLKFKKRAKRIVVPRHMKIILAGHRNLFSNMCVCCDVW